MLRMEELDVLLEPACLAEVVYNNRWPEIVLLKINSWLKFVKSPKYLTQTRALMLV